MGWFSRRSKTPAASSGQNVPFDPHLAFLAVANAETLEDRKAAVRLEMLTDEYDAMLGNYIRGLWEDGEDEFAAWAEQIRMMLRYAREVGVHEALTALDPTFPASLVDQITHMEREVAGSADPEKATVTRERLEALLSAPESASLTPYQRARMHQSLGEMYAAIWDADEGTTQIDAALGHYERALELLPPLDCLYADLFAAAAMMQNKKYERTASLRQVDLTIHNAEQAISAALYGQLGLGLYHRIWAAGLRNVAELTDDAMYWEAASSAFSQAAELARAGDPGRQTSVVSAGLCVQNYLRARHFDRLPIGLRGSTTVEWERAMRANPSLRDRFHITRKNESELPDDELPQDLDATIAALEQADRGVEGSNRLTMAQLLLARYEDGADLHDLDRADDLSAASMEDESGESLVRAHLVRLNVLAARSAPIGARRALLMAGMRLARGHPSHHGLRLARWCGDDAAGNEEWATAAEAYDTAAGVHAALVQRQVGRDYEGLALSWAAGLGASAANAHARVGDAERSAESLEHSRAQLLSTTLRRDAASLEHLISRGAEDLADRYVSALLRLSSAAKTEEPDVAEERAREDLKSAIAEIRAVDGMADFLRPLDATGLLRVAATTGLTLVYLAPSSHGGVAVIVSEEIRSELLPELTQAAAAEHAAFTALAPRSAAHAQGIDRAGRWLGEQLKDLVQSSHLPTQLALIPCGTLGFLPVDAAWFAAADGGRSYIFDPYEIRYAANAQALLTSWQRQSVTGAPRTAALVAEPIPSAAAPLRLSAFEVAVTSSFLTAAGTTVTTPEPAAATPPFVADCLRDTELLHLACHALVDHEQPLSSGVLLAGDALLTVRDVIAAEVNARLVVMSACESAAIGQSLPDEVISLPTGLIEGGCGAAIGSLWPVEDDVAALTMIVCYSRIAQGFTPATAMHEARRWLREATNSEVLELLSDVADQAAPDDSAFRDLMRDVRLGDPDDRVFAAIARWAAFQYVGA